MTRKVAYFPRWVLAVSAMVVSHHIVAGTQDKATLQVVKQLNYYVAMAFSIPFTYLLMWWIHFCVKRLDVLVPWNLYWVCRICFQLFFCVLLVLVVDVSVVRFYFFVFDNDFSASGYMQHELLIVGWMVLCMNSIYTAWFFSLNYFHGLAVNRRLRADLDRMAISQGASPIRIDASLGNKVLQVSLDEVACFERHDNSGRVHLKNGKVYNMDMSIIALQKQFETEGFFRINRSVLISLSVVKGYEKVKNMQAEVILMEGVVLGVSLVVSRGRLLGFKEAIDGYR